MGNAINSELDAQNKNLEVLSLSVDNENVRLKKANLKIAKLL